MLEVARPDITLRIAGDLRVLRRKRLSEGKLEILRAEAGAACDSREHARPQFLVIVKREDEVWPALAGKRSVRARLPFDLPADSQEGRKDAASLG